MVLQRLSSSKHLYIKPSVKKRKRYMNLHYAKMLLKCKEILESFKRKKRESFVFRVEIALWLKGNNYLLSYD